MGICHFQRFEQSRIHGSQEACGTAKLVGNETSQLASIEPVVDEIPASMGKDFRDIPLSEKKALVEEYNQILLHYHEKIQTSTAMYADSFKTVWFASSEGTYLMEEKPNLVVYLQAIARDGDIVQRGFKTTGGAEGYQMVEGFHDKATESAARAIELLSARPVKGGKYTVVTNPLMTGVFTHEAFGHLSEADFVYENPADAGDHGAGQALRRGGAQHPGRRLISRRVGHTPIRL